MQSTTAHRASPPRRAPASLGPSAASSPVAIRAQRRTRADRTVTVVGAGMAGLVAAYELERLGFRVEITEGSARGGPVSGRPGGAEEGPRSGAVAGPGPKRSPGRRPPAG
ncbi:NAD(P)-binding protein [Streptomyces sp. P9-A4]|uniref:NAD(P)-binding protein n=1 Tax=Streptomyces sp. P9-A4 TaxID=3072285 RepID=UPI002FC773BF